MAAGIQYKSGMMDSRNQGLDRFRLGTPGQQKRRATFEESHNWFENNLPSILGAVSGMAVSIPLNMVAPGAGTAAGAAVSQGTSLATMSAQGREVGPDQLAQAAVGTTLGGIQGGVQAGGEAMKNSMDVSSKLEQSVFDELPGAAGTVAPSRIGLTPEMSQGVIDHRAGLLSMQDRLDVGGTSAARQAIADDMFGSGGQSTPMYNPSERQLNMLRRMNPEVQFNPGSMSKPVYTPGSSELPAPLQGNQGLNPDIGDQSSLVDQYGVRNRFGGDLNYSPYRMGMG